jgi:chromatin remodeling complex protein RSC6
MEVQMAKKKKKKKKAKARKKARGKARPKARKKARKVTRRKTTKKKARAKARPKARRTTKKKKKKGKKRKPSAAFMKPWTPSAALAAIIGSKALPRTQVTKKLWQYIKKNKLQDKVQRTFINADANLKKVFGGKGKVSMFQMTKLVSRHLK